ncbi:MAG: class I SAM-dependent methyltransferase [Flavobacteriales bacterium]|jgi:SAM-dependent methyltransferase|nr:class I SAM-dependent methyltransferase [Flavobacteriales bacterium]
MGKKETADIREYYDGYVGRQVNAGVNERHHRIRDLTVLHGLRDGMNVLEIGCGVGTLTGLLLKEIPGGRLTATDLSPASVDQARMRLGERSNLVLVAGDSTVKVPEGPFDMIILPDVLEHIPFERQPFLFDQIKKQLAVTGRVVIHSPDPFYCEWLEHNRPELLQVVDLPLHLPGLATEIDRAGLAILHFQRHSIWMDQPDYMALALAHKPSGAYRTQPQRKATIVDRARHKIKAILTR